MPVNAKEVIDFLCFNEQDRHEAQIAMEGADLDAVPIDDHHGKVFIRLNDGSDQVWVAEVRTTTPADQAEFKAWLAALPDPPATDLTAG
jgi:hypothetical protein